MRSSERGTPWQDTTLNDVCIKITDGAHLSPKSVETGMPMASVKDLSSFGITIDTCRHISQEDFEKLIHQGCQPLEGDILIAKDGATALDTVCVMRKTMDVVLLSSVAILRPNKTKIFPAYLRYYLDSETTRSYMKAAFTTGAAIPRVVLKDFKLARIKLPPLPTQCKIAAILSPYDDLIENNLRRIKILEEMAQNLYREWFVKFRFPGHEQARFVDSALGKIPEGWEIRKVGEILKKIKRGTKIQKKDYSLDGMIPVIDQGKELVGGFTDDMEALISGDLPVIVFGDHTRILKYIDFPFACGADGTQLLKSNEDRIPSSLFYYALSAINLSNFAYARHFKFLKEETVYLPEQSIADYFDHFVLPLRDQIRVLMQKNATLRRTRDLLLPKLISGEVDVSDLDITIPEEGDGT